MIRVENIRKSINGQEILKGVERNKAIIVFPFHAWVMWWLHRIHPNAMDLMNKEAIKGFRKIRRD